MAYLQIWFDRLGFYITNIPLEILFAGFFLPVILALFSKRASVFLGSVLTAGISLLIILRPSGITLIIAVGAYAGSLLVAICGIQSIRKESAIRAELKSLRSDLNDLRIAEERSYFSELKKDNKT